MRQCELHCFLFTIVSFKQRVLGYRFVRPRQGLQDTVILSLFRNEGRRKCQDACVLGAHVDVRDLYIYLYIVVFFNYPGSLCSPWLALNTIVLSLKPFRLLYQRLAIGVGPIGTTRVCDLLSWSLMAGGIASHCGQLYTRVVKKVVSRDDLWTQGLSLHWCQTSGLTTYISGCPG